ncbi:MAG: PilZ domain-containing protein [Candidatus Sericytochromatia bacterium]|nr:PilZ domain-containing protein [Candidatus Sericytochromatia bacterium]
MGVPELPLQPGDTLDVVLEGQAARSEVISVDDDQLVVRVGIHQPALSHAGLIGRAQLADGREIKFDLGQCGRYVALELTIPLAAREQLLEEPPAIDRRRFFRLGMELDVDVIEAYGVGSGGRSFGSEIIRTRGKSVNVSGGGMLCALDQPLMPGLYTVRIYLPGETVTATAKVIRKPLASPVLTAMEFVSIHEMDRSKLIRLIFNRMRNVKALNTASPKEKAKSKDAMSRSQARREKYFSPPRIRYW